MAHVSTGNRGAGFHLPDGEPENLYERFPWLYAFCRDHLFRNDTEKIVAALWPGTVPAEGSSLLDLGCGTGFYARRLAGRFEPLRVTGVDRSARQLRRARSLAAARRLGNCSFEEGDVRALAWPTGSVCSGRFAALHGPLGTGTGGGGDAPRAQAWRTLLYSRTALGPARIRAVTGHAAACHPGGLRR